MDEGHKIYEWIVIRFGSIDKFVTKHWEPDRWGEAVELINRIRLSDKIAIVHREALEAQLHENIEELLQSFQSKFPESKKNEPTTISGDGNILDSDNASAIVRNDSLDETQRLSLMVDSLIKQNELLIKRLDSKDERLAGLVEKYEKLLSKFLNQNDKNA